MRMNLKAIALLAAAYSTQQIAAQTTATDGTTATDAVTADAPTTDCSTALLNDATIRDAVENWLSSWTREETENRHGPISQWDTSCVTNMNSIFKFAKDFDQDLSAWDTSRVRHLDLAFEASSNFAANVSTWDVSKVVSMNRIFSRSSLIDADVTGISQWKTPNLRDIRSAFLASGGFTGDLTGWDTSKCTSADRIFEETFAFSADVSGWDLNKVTQFDGMFKLTQHFAGKIGNWKVSSGALKTMEGALAGMTDFHPLDENGNNITRLDWNTENVVDMSALLQDSTNFNTDMIAHWNTKSLTNLRLAFAKSKDMHGSSAQQSSSSWDTSGVDDFSSTFMASDNFTSPLVSSFDTSSVTDMNSIFKLSKSFAADLSSWDTSKVTNMEEFAYESKNFMGIGIEEWDISSTTTLQEAFRGVQNFPVHWLSNWNTSSVKYVRDMFRDAEWSIDVGVEPQEQGEEEEDEDGPVALCWNLESSYPTQLTRATCSSPNAGFDCDCMTYELAEVVNAACPDTPPCVGTVPEEPESSDARNTTGIGEELASGAAASVTRMIWSVAFVASGCFWLL